MTSPKVHNDLITRTQMVHIAREHNIFVSRGTIHRWANESGFPYPVGKDGRSLLYSRREYETFLTGRLEKIQLEH
ncbi:MAG: hypothetical protein P9X24_17310 [Candidatus Hatepunaea meridiana]|nr:hypothetical protein [Candidatus Hatepunaea meridiana]